MKDKNGFTLVEILAVIALIGVVMLLVTPNVVDIFRNANSSVFHDEVINLYSSAYTTYIYRSSKGDYNKRFCVGKDTTTSELDVEEKEDLYYDITVNAYGSVLSLKVSNGTYGIDISDSGGIKKKNIKASDITDGFDINCNNIND